MKYFTKDWYNEYQIACFLIFPETEKEWEEYVDSYQRAGKNFNKSCRERLEYHKNDLLKFLPESFHSYIHDGTIISQYPSEELRTMAKQWGKEYEKRMDMISKEYHKHYLSVKGVLRENVVQWYEKSLHDAVITSIEIPSQDTFIMTLDCRGGFSYFTDVKFTFEGVKKLVMPDTLVGSWWLYNEIYVAEAGFELRVLLSPLSEMLLVAENVLIEVLN